MTRIYISIMDVTGVQTFIISFSGSYLWRDSALKVALRLRSGLMAVTQETRLLGPPPKLPVPVGRPAGPIGRAVTGLGSLSPPVNNNNNNNFIDGISILTF